MNTENNNELLSVCERCGLKDVPKDAMSCISEFDKNGYKVDIQVCPMCFDQIREQEYEQAEEYMVVTREMAIDAGDRTLEGTKIKW